MKIILVFGTRPEAIKMCPVVIELKKYKNVETVVCLTGQHKEMLDQVIDIFDINVDYNLGIMKENQTLAMISYNILKELDSIYMRENPDLVLVHGDTTTSFVAALAAFYRNIPIGHVEAGLRTYNMRSPFPEEFNRQSIDMVAELMFAPTEQTRNNLIKEGKDKNKIYVTGNTAIDTLKITTQYNYSSDLIKWVNKDRLILLTAHRRENIGEPLENILMAIKKIVENINDVKIIYPVHKNPLIRDIVKKIIGDNEKIKIAEPLDVVQFHNLMKRSYLILTDSGGIQEEAPALGVPVLVLRDTTERPEGVAAGTLRLVGTNTDKIYNETKKLLMDNCEYEKMSKAINPYGDGNASKHIVNILLDYGRYKNVK